MYLNTDILTARTGTGWWRLASHGKVELTMTHKPDQMTPYVRGTLRRWIRAGYCDAPNGEASKRWQLLMLMQKPRYLMQVSKGNYGVGFQASLFNQPGQVCWVPPMEHLNALLLLHNASLPSRMNHEPLSLSIQKSDDEIRVGMDLISTNHLRVWHGFRLWEHKKLLKTFVRELGHPLGDKEAINRALKTIDEPSTMRVNVIDRDRFSFTYTATGDKPTVIQFTPWHNEEES